VRVYPDFAAQYSPSLGPRRIKLFVNGFPRPSSHDL
jgi:hypothetical protein